ncbi:alpha-tectorin-like isoform X1 [Simochromis diagramma]|uniref:alpha-tectorin-like isoform X1 n=1 Tax=Simochromis diagramma TaxID=43689 RepID=UPI001A7E2D14|nr:alpha-tectorin-like isoform X1 [Simochromis diagramma]XP_039865801.1 alpha-tectorin-like isoform X1 [Simochromis diagramma]
MLRPLLFLCALIAPTGAQWSYQQTFNESSVVDISSCPITYYGQQYEQLYVNITSGNVTVCFNGFFNPETGGDCIVERSLGTESFYFQTYSNYYDYCYFYIYFNNMYLVHYISGTQPYLYSFNYISDPTEFELQVGGTTVDTVNVTAYATYYFSISGCRHSGQMYRPGTVISSDPQTCFSLTCNETAVLNTSSCGALERCQGNGICTLDTMLASTCTVTGPTVINVHGQINSIQDRCAYSLFSTPSLPDFLVLGNFRDRRRKDVSFLDSVTLRVDGHDIHLEQGGRVQLDDSTLTLSSSSQLVHGVQLSKDQTGVTAELTNLNISVFFDGDTAQIVLEGPAGSSVEGLCGNSSRSLSDLRLSEYSSTSCEMQYSETADTTIDCNSVTERCNLLKEAPFSSCNSDIDPEPYITACTNTLCKYPAVDGLNCQFLKAYARACSLHNHALDGWTSKTGCSSEAFCQDRTCSDHEFCGEKTVGGDTRCFCRAIFASKYQENNSFGDPTVCMQDSASVTLVGCLLEDKGLDYSALHLNDPTCRGQVDELTHMVTFGFNSSNSCGTVVTTNNSELIYKNTIMTQNSSSDIITRHDQVYIDFSCVQTQPDIKTATFRIRDSSVIQHITSGVWDYTLIMKAFTDAGRTQAVESSTEVQLNQKIWVELKTDGLDGDMVAVVTDSCWATDQPSPDSSPRYDLIINGCANPADQTVQVKDNGLGTSNYFSFNMFEFTGGSGEVFLHCKLHVCPKQNNCVPTCPGAARRRRSARSKYEGEAFISMAWTH